MGKRSKKRDVGQSQPKCYLCEEPLSEGSNTYRTVSRGDRKGQRVGPWCVECLTHAERHCVVEPEEQ